MGIITFIEWIYLLKKVYQLTNSGDSFDFHPVFINSEDFVFFRLSSEDKVSLWKLEKGQEIKLLDDVLLSDSAENPVDGFYGHINTYKYVSIK
jgi:hypothetical protein